MLRILSMLFLALCIGNVHAAAKKQSQQRKTIPKAIASAKAVHKPAQQAALRSGRAGAKQRFVRRAVAPPPPEIFNPDVLDIQSTAVLVVNSSNGSVIFDKNVSAVSSIASIT